MSIESGDSDEDVCPLCCEELDKNFLPCSCGYRVCIWCWHNIKDNTNGRCPACRTPYSQDPHAFAVVDQTEVRKTRQRRKSTTRQQQSLGGVIGTGNTVLTQQNTISVRPSVTNRQELHPLRVIQRNLVYVVGLPPSAATEEIIRKPEYFGQFGKINKIVPNLNQGVPVGDIRHGSASAYITFAHREDARACIHSVNGFVLDGRAIKANFGTSKYCNSFLRHLPCNNPECMYLHEMGDEEDRFTKDEIQSLCLLAPSVRPGVPTASGGGGPSGTGKRCLNPILPAPVWEIVEPTRGRTPAVGNTPSTASLSRQSPPLRTSATVALRGQSANRAQSEGSLTATPVLSGVQAPTAGVGVWASSGGVPPPAVVNPIPSSTSKPPATHQQLHQLHKLSSELVSKPVSLSASVQSSSWSATSVATPTPAIQLETVPVSSVNDEYWPSLGESAPTPAQAAQMQARKGGNKSSRIEAIGTRKTRDRRNTSEVMNELADEASTSIDTSVFTSDAVATVITVEYPSKSTPSENIQLQSPLSEVNRETEWQTNIPEESPSIPDNTESSMLDPSLLISTTSSSSWLYNSTSSAAIFNTANPAPSSKIASSNGTSSLFSTTSSASSMFSSSLFSNTNTGPPPGLSDRPPGFVPRAQNLPKTSHFSLDMFHSTNPPSVSQGELYPKPLSPLKVGEPRTQRSSFLGDVFGTGVFSNTGFFDRSLPIENNTGTKMRNMQHSVSPPPGLSSLRDPTVELANTSSAFNSALFMNIGLKERRERVSGTPDLSVDPYANNASNHLAQLLGISLPPVDSHTSLSSQAKQSRFSFAQSNGNESPSQSTNPTPSNASSSGLTDYFSLASIGLSNSSSQPQRRYQSQQIFQQQQQEYNPPSYGNLRSLHQQTNSRADMSADQGTDIHRDLARLQKVLPNVSLSYGDTNTWGAPIQPPDSRRSNSTSNAFGRNLWSMSPQQNQQQNNNNNVNNNNPNQYPTW